MAQRTSSSKVSSAQPSEVILKLLMAADGEALTTRDAVGGCTVFGISENHARVALVRLSSAGMIEATGRGSYRIGPEAARLATEVSRWRAGEKRTRPWKGRWVVVHTAPLGRRDRKALRQRDRALSLLGLHELERGLYVRPDNLVDGIPGIRERLMSIGLEATAAVYAASEFDEDREAQARRLWDGKALNRVYEKTRSQLEAWMARADELDLVVAARESYLMGGKAIRLLVFDPLLPDPLVDTTLRAALTETVLRFDRVGHAIWQRLAMAPAQPRSAAVRATSRAH